MRAEGVDLRSAALRVAFEGEMEGGKADDAELSQFDPVSLCRGLLVELEHTDDAHAALEIAMDHLVEDPRYYEALAEMEAGLEEARGQDSMT